MVTVTSTALQEQFGRYREIAQREPVSITSHGRVSLVLLSADEYRRLKALDTRRAYSTMRGSFPTTSPRRSRPPSHHRRTPSTTMS